MDNISELLKEAKPLYFEKKDREKRCKIAFSVALPIFFFSLFLSTSLYNYYSLVSMSSDSAITEMGLPTDAYGLLKVD